MSKLIDLRIPLVWLATTILTTAGAGAQTTWYVDDDAPGDPGPGDPAISDPAEDGPADHPFDAIQEAIDAAADDDTVLVADGPYVGEGNRNLFLRGKAIAVRSENGPQACTIDCEHRTRGFYVYENETPQRSSRASRSAMDTHRTAAVSTAVTAAPRSSTVRSRARPSRATAAACTARTPTRP